MKLAFLAESHADEEVARILSEAVLGRAVERIEGPRLRTRGWPAILKETEVVIRHVHFQTDAFGLVILFDSNRSQPHTAAHVTATTEDCRFCAMSRLVDQTRGRLSPVGHRETVLPVATGMAVPQIEAWLLAGKDPGVSEAAWVNGLASGAPPYDSDRLKRDAYGFLRAPAPRVTEVSIAEANRLAADLPLLEERFPVGFGALATELRSWA